MHRKKSEARPLISGVLRATRHSLPATKRVSEIATNPSSTEIPRQKVMNSSRPSAASVRGCFSTFYWNPCRTRRPVIESRVVATSNCGPGADVQDQDFSLRHPLGGPGPHFFDSERSRFESIVL